MNSEQSQPKIYELKCKVCGKVCGTLAFPAESEIDTEDLSQSHETVCDEHAKNKIKQK